MSFKRGMRNLYLIMILLIVLLSTHIKYEPSFFRTNKTKTTHGYLSPPCAYFRAIHPQFVEVHHVQMESFYNGEDWEA